MFWGVPVVLMDRSKIKRENDEATISDVHAAYKSGARPAIQPM
jgi:hypothetical protein